MLMLLVWGSHFENHWTQCRTFKESHLPFHRMSGVHPCVIKIFGSWSILNRCLYFILLFYFILYLPWIHSAWLSIILANNFALISLILLCIGPLIWNMLFSFQLWLWLLSTKTAFPAWLCGLRSSPLNPAWQATASQVGPSWFYLMQSAKPPMTYL